MTRRVGELVAGALRSSLLRSVLAGVGLAVAGWILGVIIFASSISSPETPTALFLDLVGDALSENPGRYGEGEARAIMFALSWFQGFVIPGLSGIGVGLVAGAFRRFTWTSYLVAGAAAALLTFATQDVTTARCLGILGFLFALAGACHGAAAARDAVVAWRESRQGENTDAR